MTTHKAQTEIDYKAEVLKVHPHAYRDLTTGRHRIVSGVTALSMECASPEIAWQDAYSRLPVAQTDRAEGAKERVLAVYPDMSVWAGYGDDPKYFTVHSSRLKEQHNRIGQGATPELAIEDAASKLPLPNQKEAEPEPRPSRAMFDQMSWPIPDHQAGWQMRYNRPPSPETCMTAASEMDAYAALISMPNKKRNYIVSKIKEAMNG